MLTIILITLGICSRLVPHLSQFTAILAVAFFAGLYLKGWQAIAIPLAIMMASDVIIGFHDTMFYTWGSMIMISAIGLGLQKQRNFAMVLGGSMASALVFFVITNFGAFLSLYPHTLEGLRECYILAVPFFRSTLLSTVAYSLVLYATFEWLSKSIRVRETSVSARG